MKLSPRDIEHFRARLQTMARQIAADASTVAEQALLPSGGQTAGELSDAPTHIGDRGTEEYLSEVNSTLLENEQYLVAELSAALVRIEARTFGPCESCRAPIGKERLEAIPYTRLCVKC